MRGEGSGAGRRSCGIGRERESKSKSKKKKESKKKKRKKAYLIHFLISTLLACVRARHSLRYLTHGALPDPPFSVPLLASLLVG